MIQNSEFRIHAIKLFSHFNEKSYQNIWPIQKFFVTLQCQRKEVKLRALSVKIAGIKRKNCGH